MYKAFMSDGIIIESESIKSLYYAAETDRRYTDGCLGEGIHGYVIRNDAGKEIYRVKHGYEYGIKDVGFSVRAYNAIMRRALMNGLIKSADDVVTMRQLRDWAEDGYLRGMSYVGVKTYEEIFDCILKYTGWTRRLNAALENCMCDSVNGIKWLRENMEEWQNLW